MASTRVVTIWEKRAEVPDASLKAGPKQTPTLNWRSLPNFD
jgi:hypothetical protein